MYSEFSYQQPFFDWSFGKSDWFHLSI